MRAKTICDTRREEIIATAGDLFSGKGYHGTSIPDIARAVGISTGLIYYIFPSKEEILLACFEALEALHLDFFTQASAITNPLKRFDAIVLLFYTSIDKGSKLLIILYRDSSTLPRDVRQQMLSTIKNLDNHFLELFQEGQRNGIFAQNIPYPYILAANVLGLGHLWGLHKTWHFAPEIDLEMYIAAQLAYFHVLLLPATAQPGSDEDKQEALISIPDQTSLS
jgi:TetR/AcrR family transcriptional regulator, cholesterol catabolism regulator